MQQIHRVYVKSFTNIKLITYLVTPNFTREGVVCEQGDNMAIEVRFRKQACAVSVLIIGTSSWLRSISENTNRCVTDRPGEPTCRF